jgi:hypothetical protein
MRNNYRWMAVVLLIACLPLAACSQAPATTPEDRPATVEHLEGAEPTRVTLTEDAAKRLDIQTATVRDAEDNGAQRKVIPYSAILYDTQGDTWTYTNPEPLTFVRHHIVVDRIEGDQAFLSDGPSSGTAVVTVGAEELYGSETEFQEE